MENTTCKELLVVSNGLSEQEFAELFDRASFFCPGWNLVPCSPTDFASLDRPLLFFEESPPDALCYDVNPSRNSEIDCDWCRLATFHCSGWDIASLIDHTRNRFKQSLMRLQEQGLQRCYVFGFGKSLSRALSRSWKDGYRIACNSLPRNEELWNHLSPHFLVLVNVRSFFGASHLAVSYRRLLRERLCHTETFLVYPLCCHAIALREFSEFEERLIPVPSLRDHHFMPDLNMSPEKRVSLAEDFAVGPSNNLLTQYLLPLAFSLSRSVFLFGFDGRAPNGAYDLPRWSSDFKNRYPSDYREIQTALPDFFQESCHQSGYQPDADFEAELETVLQIAEQRSYEVTTLHRSAQPSLEKRRKHTLLASNSGKPAKMAFLFLTSSILPHEEYWVDFFRGFEPYFTLYIHANEGVFSSNYFSDCVVPAWIPSLAYEQHEQVAQLALLRIAYGNPENSYFLFLYEESLPLQRFPVIYNSLTEDERSVMDFWIAQELDRDEDFKRRIGISHIYQNSKHFLLNREHARLLLEDENLLPEMRHLQQLIAHYPSTLLNYHACFDKQEVENRNFVYYSPSPIREIDALTLSALQKKHQEGCLFAEQFDTRCDLSRLRLDVLGQRRNDVIASDIPLSDITDENFDEAYYLEAYPDVFEAVRRGAFRSGFEHYVRNGRSEGRAARVLV